ncbi:unnamed protein product [Musa acuminata subsp. burmannicoides]
MSVSLSENTSQDSSTIEEAVLSIPFAIIDEIADDSPAAEDGLLLIDEFVKFGNVENGDNLQSRLVAEAHNSQAGCIDEYNRGTSTMAWSWKFGNLLVHGYVSVLSYTEAPPLRLQGYFSQCNRII